MLVDIDPHMVQHIGKAPALDQRVWLFLDLGEESLQPLPHLAVIHPRFRVIGITVVQIPLKRIKRLLGIMVFMIDIPKIFLIDVFHSIPSLFLKDVKKRITEAPSIEDVIKKNVKNNGKYIYFCP
ncbi:MAG: hypothetical protein IJB97_05010, partial [Clostridia bacterium]|nr:hypothetical protein [Clostridia bacterium]